MLCYFIWYYNRPALRYLKSEYIGKIIIMIEKKYRETTIRNDPIPSEKKWRVADLEHMRAHELVENSIVE